ncbi:hypothetical protein [Runella sp. SP2]|uniref:hypothetical protein n=1 Tax=Runella sp. SP2 TaxID=2268026 RepID=UPI000F0769A3|nr:hypothetical protein [Runella sp. SP2]AYQ31969.1 hypothetical protein DTQ70_07190 [Runella sp. SP2]
MALNPDEYENTGGGGTTSPPDTTPTPTTPDGLPSNLFTWMGETQGKTVTLAMYNKYNNAVTLDPATGLISVSFGLNATAEKEELLTLFEQVIQWNANNTATDVSTRIGKIRTKLNKAVPTDGVYDAWELALFWSLAVNPTVFLPVALTDSVLDTYVMLAVEKNGATLATRIQTDWLRLRNPNNPLPNPQPGSDTNDPNPTPTGGTTPVNNSNLTPWLVAVVVMILLLLAVRFR